MSLSALEQAEEIVRQEPLPEDARARVQALEDVADEFEKPLFVYIWESLYVQESL